MGQKSARKVPEMCKKCVRRGSHYLNADGYANEGCANEGASRWD